MHSHEYDDYRDTAIRADDDLWFATNANKIAAAWTPPHWSGGHSSVMTTRPRTI